jgi:hypothetical protein
MRIRTWLTIPLFLFVAAPLLASPLQCIVNGDFEEELEIGWQQHINCTSVVVMRTLYQDDDPDYELWTLVDNGVGEVSIWQRFPIPNLDLEFTAEIKVLASGSGQAWAVSGIGINYMDWNMDLLGRTLIGMLSYDCPWTESETFHIIEIFDSQWYSFEFNLNDELANLPGVDPQQIAYLEVEVLAVADNC